MFAMKKLFAIALFTASVLAAQASTAIAYTQANPGVLRFWPPSTPATAFNVNISGSAGQNISAVEFTIALPVGATATAAPGAAGTLAGKTTACGPISAAGLMTCILYGMNNTVLADGILATVSATLPTTTTPGTATIASSNLLSASNAGAAVAVSAGTVLSVSIANPCDFNGDGAVNGQDLSVALNQALGVQTCGLADLIGNGVCTGINGLIDVVRVILASGGSCKVGQ